MGVTDWFHKLFSGSPTTGNAENDAILREEYGSSFGMDGPAEPGLMQGAPGVSGFAGLEDSEAVEGVEEQTEAPEDPAP